MIFNPRALLCALAVLSTLEPILAKRNFGGGGRSHSYPKSGGLSGGGSHSYPSSGGLSGGGHGYPSSGGMSGGGHGYPSSGGMSGGSHGYPSSGGSHAYPANTGSAGSNTHHTNNHGYPSGKGLSGNSQPAAGHTTNIHNNYHYSPPQQIRYTPVHGGAPVSYPVYHGTPPTYVYQYRDSGSKYGTLLTGLALLNLGTLAAGTAYAVSHSGSHGSGSSSGSYTPRPGEVCKFGIRKDNGDYEETKIDCQLISSFILQDQARSQNGGGNNATVTTTTVTNVTVVNTTSGASVPPPAADAPAASTVYTMFPNGTLVPLNMTTTANVTNNVTSAEPSPSNTMTVTTTTTNTTVTNALDVKGSPVSVTPGMKCYVIRQSPTSNMKKTVECGLLQTYAEKSIRPNSAASHAPAFTILAALVAFVLY